MLPLAGQGMEGNMESAGAPLPEAAAAPDSPESLREAPAAVESPRATRYIQPPGKGRPARAVATELLYLIRTEFCYNTASLCRLLLCERQWVDRTLRPEVEHLFITRYFRQYMLDTCSDLTEEERALLRHGYYFYSAESLCRYWNTHAVAQRRTRLVDLADYRAKGVSLNQLGREVRRHAAEKPCAAEKARHLAAMESLLTPEGFLLLRQAGEKTEWISCPLPPLSPELPLVTAPVYRKRNRLGSNTSAMNHLIRQGAIRIKLGSRALWLLPETRFACPLAVQADSVPDP